MRSLPPQFTVALIGLRVSRPWKGYGSAIFLELGELSEVQVLRGGGVRGQACIFIEWDWRLELGSSIIVGSSDRGPAINACLKRLRDSVVTSIEIEGQVPELLVRLSTGHVLRSMAMVHGDPQWSIRADQRDQWLYVENGDLVVGDGAEHLTESESRTFALAEGAASRWGVPTAAPKLGECRDCRHFVFLDGPGHLLDYGCCISELSPFDGRAVYCTSGCPEFTGASDD